MGANTSIAWATHTFNPWIGCTRVSSGCVNCYAETQDARGIYGGTKHWGPGKPRHLTSESYMSQPFAWNDEQRRHEHVHFSRGTMPEARPRVFCLSMGDICDPDAPPQRLEQTLQTIEQTPYLDWLLLTKRPERYAEVLTGRVGRGPLPYFPPNLWLGTTTEDQQRHDERVPELLSVPAAVWWLSMEPMLGPIVLHTSLIARAKRFPGRVWVICGGESGRGARPFDLGWAWHLQAQCKQAGILFFMKQLGAFPVRQGGRYPTPGDRRKGGNMEDWPPRLRQQQVPGSIVLAAT